jgi:hypothetical protein
LLIQAFPGVVFFREVRSRLDAKIPVFFVQRARRILDVELILGNRVYTGAA